MAEKLFDHYKQLSVKKGGLETIDAVQAPAFEQLATDLGIDVEDPVLLVLAWKCNAETPFQISRNEWKNGMAKLGVKDASTLKGKVPQLRKDVTAKPAFRDFYFWVFGFVKEGDQKVLANDAAVAYWRLLLSKPPMNWELLDEWCDFVENVHKKAIVKDVWKQLYDFMTLPNLAAYDPNGAWPTMIDDFVEYLKEKGKAQ